jgi:hypothetical protein
MEQSSREVNTSSASQEEIPHIVLNLLLHDIPPLAPFLNLVHAVSSYYLRSFVIQPSHICIHLPSSVFPSDFPTKTIHIFCRNGKTALEEMLLIFQIKSIVVCQEIFSEDVWSA